MGVAGREDDGCREKIEGAEKKKRKKRRRERREKEKEKKSPKRRGSGRMSFQRLPELLLNREGKREMAKERWKWLPTHRNLQAENGELEMEFEFKMEWRGNLNDDSTSSITWRKAGR